MGYRGRVGSRWPLCGPGPAWRAVQPRGPRLPPGASLPPALGPANSPFEPQIFAFLTSAEKETRVLKLANWFWKRQESLTAHGEKQPSVGASPAWHGWHIPTSFSFPDLPFRWLSWWKDMLPAGSSTEDSDLTISDYYWTPYKPLSESTVSSLLSSEAQLWRETLDWTSPSSHQQSWLRSYGSPLNENHKSSESSLKSRLLTP